MSTFHFKSSPNSSFKTLFSHCEKFDCVPTNHLFLPWSAFVQTWSVTCHIYSKVVRFSLPFSASVIAFVKSSVIMFSLKWVFLWSVVSLMGWGTWALFVMMFMFWERVSCWWQTFLLSRIMRTENSLLLPRFSPRNTYLLTLQFTQINEHSRSFLTRVISSQCGRTSSPHLLSFVEETLRWFSTMF